MRLHQMRLLGLSIAVLFLLITVISSDSFATSVTHEISSPFLINFRNVSDQGSIDDVEDAIIVLDQESYQKGDTAFLEGSPARGSGLRVDRDHASRRR